MYTVVVALEGPLKKAIDQAEQRGMDPSVD
jgi:hypothetical protein